MIFFPIIAVGMAASVCAAVVTCLPLALLNGEPKQKPDKPKRQRPACVEQPKRERPRLVVVDGGWK